MDAPNRYVAADDWKSFRPVYVVWELTLACNLRCAHCGSRAGRRRPGELSTDECIELVAQLAELGAREITLIGGEAYLRPDWIEIVAAIRAAGMACTLQTGGRHLTEVRMRQAAAAGLQAVGVSIDGLQDVHDRLRGVKGSFDAALAALKHARSFGLSTSVNTTLTRPVVPQLAELMAQIVDAGSRSWKLGLAVPMGRAADNPDLLLQPYDLLRLMPLLADLWREGVAHGLAIVAGNTLGYYGPYEAMFRGAGNDPAQWVGCTAGCNSIGIEADGTIKGCPSLSRTPYAGGNVRNSSLHDIWTASPAIVFNRNRTIDDLWGFCRTCYYADVCRAGCTWMTHSLFGRAGNNPYCHHRASTLAKQGLRERVVQVAPPPGVPFDRGRFELLLERVDGNGAAIVCSPPSSPPADLPRSVPLRLFPARGRDLPQRLRVCRGCNSHVKRDATNCPHCGGNLQRLEQEYANNLAVARSAKDRLAEVLAELRAALVRSDLSSTDGVREE